MLLEYLDSINLVSINVILLFRSTMAANDGDESPNRDQGQPKSGFNAKELLQNLARFMAQ